MTREYNAREAEFLKELKALFEKYGAFLSGVDDYDSNEEYCGTGWTVEAFVDGEENIYITLDELNDVV